jgi:GNAT superfamily N-acetyltransferase
VTGSSASDVRIELAADHLDLVPIVARWHWERRNPDEESQSLASWTDGLLTRINRDRIPATFFAFDGPALVASTTLVEHDMPDRVDLAHLRPWLAGVYVVADRRGRGFGSRLVDHAERSARAFGVGRLYLYTTEARGFYERLGWRRTATDRYGGETITIMAKDLG